MANQTTKLLICLWKGCECVFEAAGSFQEHVNNHVQEQMQLNLDTHQKKNDGNREEGNEPLAKRAKLNDEKEMEKEMEKECKIVFLAIEVWLDVLGFIKRIKLARTVSLTNRRIHQICWPRLHGCNVKTFEVDNIVIGRRGRIDGPAAALQIKKGQGIPIPDCAPPAYITNFRSIEIKFVDQEVVQFLTHISGCIMANKGITISFRMGKLNAKKHCAFMDQLLHIFREKSAKIYLVYHCPMACIPSPLPEMELQISMFLHKFKENVDIPILLKTLASPRADGRQWVFSLSVGTDELSLKVIDAIKQDFRSSTQQLPQPFYIRFRLNLNPNNNNGNWPIGISEEEENEQTTESLFAFGHVGEYLTVQRYFTICRHPKGQHEQWAEDAARRLLPSWVPRKELMSSSFIKVEL